MKYQSTNGTLHVGDALEVLKTLDSESVNTCVTSPPYYGLRDYGHDGQVGRESTPEEFISNLVQIFREVKRVLSKDGTLWVNIGDSYCGTGSKGEYQDPKNKKGRNGQSKSLTQKLEGVKSKDLIGIPWMLAFALRADGWYLRQDIIWHKPNPMPESVQDRCTKSHEYIFLMSKSPKYYFDSDSIKEPLSEKSDVEYRNNLRKGKEYNVKSPYKSNFPSSFNLDGKNKRSVWTVSTKPYSGAHFAVYPPELIETCIKAGCPEGGIVLDPFFGSGTTGETANRLGRKFLGIELNPEYAEIAYKRSIKQLTIL